MPNTQHFIVSIHYDGDEPDTFDAEQVSDVVYDSFCESDNIHRIDRIETHEEPVERPTYDELDKLVDTYPPAMNVTGPDLAIASVVNETLAYALGRIPVDELHEAIARAQRIAVPVTVETLGRTPQTIRNEPTTNDQGEFPCH